MNMFSLEITESRFTSLATALKLSEAQQYVLRVDMGLSTGARPPGVPEILNATGLQAYEWLRRGAWHPFGGPPSS